MQYQIEIKVTDTKGVFTHQTEGRKGGEMTFSIAGPERIIIDHTEVEDDFRGKGVGFALVEFAVNYVRERQIKMLPLCPFTKATLLKHPEWKDVW